ncbi:MAG TPA: alginate lyase family protein [Pyrinomonadaceae bacterium]|nr:alginate lyase family protein [Pyrinomonadaceae bacterium]
MTLEKIRKASLHELRVRAAQKVAAFSERRGWSDLVKLPADDVFAGAAHDLLEHFRSRSEPAFFASFKNPEQIVADLKSRWPETAQQLVEKADRIGEGKFDLLGFQNLSFGIPIDWHFEPLSGKRIPLQHWSKLDYLDVEVAGDKKIIWELNRHQYFMTLGQAYLLTGDERTACVFATHIDAWMEANPPKLGINWASSLEVAFRSMSWLWAFYFFKSSPSLSVETFKRAWKFLYLSARHLESYLSTYFSPNTHLTGEALGLFYLGTLLPEFKEAKRWQELGRQILIEQLPIHIKRDGVYFEQSSYYHRYTADFYIHFLLLSRANNVTLPRAVEETLVLLLDHLMYITRPDGTTPFFGDDDGGRLAMLDTRPANDFRGTLGTGAVLFDRGDYKFVASDAAEELLWLTGAEGLNKFDSIAATEPAKTSVPFFEGGYFVMRDGWSRQSNYLLFDCGPHGALNCGHAHADALSIDVAANGRTVLVDPGTYTYTGSKELRDWFRSSHAHNTVTVDDESSSLPDGPFTWKTTAQCSLQKWISEDRFDFVSGQHDGYMRLQEPAMVKREILFLKGDYWIVRDTISSGEHRVDVRFHFAPGADSILDIHCFGSGQWVEEKGSVSHCYGQKEAAKALSFSATSKGGAEIISFLLPQTPGNDPVVQEIEAQDGRRFVINGAKTVDLVIIPPAASWVWTRTIDGVVTERVTIK